TAVGVVLAHPVALGVAPVGLRLLEPGPAADVLVVHRHRVAALPQCPVDVVAVGTAAARQLVADAAHVGPGGHPRAVGGVGLVPGVVVTGGPAGVVFDLDQRGAGAAVAVQVTRRRGPDLAVPGVAVDRVVGPGGPGVAVYA